MSDLDRLVTAYRSDRDAMAARDAAMAAGRLVTSDAGAASLQGKITSEALEIADLVTDSRKV